MSRLSKIFRPIARVVLPRTVVVGIDVQDRHISIVSLRQYLRQARVKPGSKVIGAQQQISEETIEEGAIASPAKFFDAVKLLLGILPINRLKSEPAVALSLPPHHIYTETMLLPIMPEAGLREAVELKLETSLPWPVGESYYDWRKIKIDDPRKIGVFIAAVAKKTLDAYLRAFMQGGWRVASCEFHLMSLARLIHGESELPFILILIDEDGAEFAVMHRGQMLAHFLRRGDHRAFTEILPFETRRLATYAEGELKLKIRRVYVFDKLGLENQLAFLEEKTGLAVRPLASAESDLDARLYIAAGAASRRFDEEEGINLVPPGSGGRFNETLIVRTARLWTGMLAAFGAIVVLSCAAVYLFLRADARALARENTDLAASVERQVAQSKEEIARAESFNALADSLARARTFEAKYGVKFSAIVEAAASNRLTVLNMRSQNPDGPFIVALAAPARDDVVAFKSALEQEGVFKSVSVPVAQLIPEQDLRVDATIQ